MITEVLHVILCDTNVITFRHYKSMTRRMTVYAMMMILHSTQIHYHDDNESESNAACARQEQASDVEESDQDSGDGGFHGDDNDCLLYTSDAADE